MTYTDGQPLDAELLRIEGNRLTEAEHWTTTDSPYTDGETVGHGEQFELWMHVEDELRITWVGEEETAILQRYDRPER